MTLRTVRRTIALAFACSLVLAAAAHAQVTVVASDGGRTTLTQEQVDAQRDVVDQPYTLRTDDGREREEVVSGLSLPALLDAAEADPVTFSSVEIGPSGGSAVLTLSQEQATRSSAFPEGPAVVTSAGGGLGFLRPKSSADDPNAADRFTAPAGIELRLRDRGAIRVRAKASPTRVEPGERVTFTATAQRSGSGPGLRYRWTFDDGSRRGAGATVTHRYRKRGTYKAVVGVTSADDAAGGFETVTVQVGAPRKGPNREGGGTRNAESAPDSGPGTGSGAGGPGSAQAPGREAGGRDRDPSQRRAPAGAGGDLVRGELLTRTPAPARQEPAPRAARTGMPKSASTLPTELWALAAALGLMAIGAALEHRGRPGAASRAPVSPP